MSEEMPNMSPCNAFIFNWIENYDDKLHNLTESMRELNNRVIVYNKLNERELLEAVELIRRSNFTIYNYIVIIILDNKSKCGRFITTNDGIEVLLDTEILTIIQRNKTLRNKPRLFVIQKLLDIKSLGDVQTVEDNLRVKNRNTLINERNSYYKNLPKILHKGLTIEIKALEFTGNYQASPFIDTFCNEFKTQARTIPIDKIYSNIYQEIKTKQKYKIVIEFGNNQSQDDNLIFGEALSADELRDFFPSFNTRN